MYRTILASLICLRFLSFSDLWPQEATRFKAISSTNSLAKFIPLSSPSTVNASAETAKAITVANITSPDIPSLYATSWTHELLQTRQYHGDEVSANSGEQWWGLFATDNGFELLPTIISINTVRDAIIDRKDGELTGKEVVTDRALSSVFLIKGPDPLAPGPVKTVFFGDSNLPGLAPAGGGVRYAQLMLGMDISLRLSLDDSAVPNLPTQSIFNFKNFTWTENRNTVLTISSHSEGKTQKFDLGWCCNMVGPSLIWAGDLDRDGKLDFLLDVTTHYNSSEPTLFLSSLAEEGEIVRPVATIRSIGC